MPPGRSAGSKDTRPRAKRSTTARELRNKESVRNKATAAKQATEQTKIVTRRANFFTVPRRRTPAVTPPEPELSQTSSSPADSAIDLGTAAAPSVAFVPSDANEQADLPAHGYSAP